MAPLNKGEVGTTSYGCMQVQGIHAGSSPGGILVFLTGYQEVQQLCTRLESAAGPEGERSVRVGSCP